MVHAFGGDQKCWLTKSSHLEPGGYLEHAEVAPYPKCDDGSMGSDHILHRWHDLARQAEQVTGRDLFISDSMREAIERAGFVDVVEKRVAIPIGPWSSDENYKQIGKWYKLCWITGMENWIMALCTRYLKVSVSTWSDTIAALTGFTQWTVEEVQDFVRETKHALDDRSLHVYYHAYV